MSLRTFTRTTSVATSAASLFAWHEQPGAFERLTPPGEPVRVLRHIGGIRNGARVSVRVGFWPFSFRWDLAHTDYRPGESFTDVQVRGPFTLWRHQHRMVPVGPDSCTLEDRIEFELPYGVLGTLVARLVLEPKLQRLFDYRHRVTRDAFRVV